MGSPTIQRDDETEEAITKRLDTFNEQTAPLVDFYGNEGMLLDINATSSDVVVNTIKEKLAS
jgi:adenylate kinase